MYFSCCLIEVILMTAPLLLKKEHDHSTYPIEMSQESMKSKRVNPQHTLIHNGYPSKVIFRHGAQFFRGLLYRGRFLDFVDWRRKYMKSRFMQSMGTKFASQE